MTYQEKLKDPRWQKKRLKILERDRFACQYCGDNESTLHVHHLVYNKGGEPWDIEDNMLLTVCESCHGLEHDNRDKAEKSLIKALKETAVNYDGVNELAYAFLNGRPSYPQEVIIDLIGRVLCDPNLQEKIFQTLYPVRKAALKRKYGANLHHE